MWTELLLAAALAVPTVEVTPEGDTLVVVPDSRVDLVGVRIALPVGRLSPWWWSASAAAAWHLPLTDAELSDRIDDRMALTLSGDDWSTTLEAHFRTGDLDTALSALQDLLAGGTIDRDALQAWRGAGRGPWDAPRSMLSVMVERILLDPHDLRRQPAPPPPRRLAPLQRTHAALVGIRNRIIGFTGDITESQAREAAAAPPPPSSTDQPDGLQPILTPIPATGGTRAGWLPGAGQGAVLLARGSLARTDPDYPALRVELHALAGGARCRLLVALRHEAGLIYSLTAEDGTGPVPGLLTVTIPTRASQLAQTSQLTGEVLAAFAGQGITDAERDRAIRALRLTAPATPDEILLELMETLRHGWPRDHRVATIDAAQALPIERINAFIADFFSPDSVALLRVLPSPGLSPASP